jgi:hypothetical protein
MLYPGNRIMLRWKCGTRAGFHGGPFALTFLGEEDESDLKDILASLRFE